MDKRDLKSKQLERSLSRLGVLVADAADSLETISIAAKTLTTKLMRLQSEIEQIYMTLEEPLEAADTK